MKIKIEVDNSLEEEEIIIKCPRINDKISNIQKKIQDIADHNLNIIFYKDNKEYYIQIDNVLFFEIEENICVAHTRDDTFIVKHRLYELESKLGKNFVRISKSAVVNVKHILSLSNSFGSSTLIEFNKSYKKVYVSRSYTKALKYRLKERKNYEI